MQPDGMARGLWGRIVDLLLLRALQHARHQLVQLVDGFERAHHHLEAGDLTGAVPADHVHPVDENALLAVQFWLDLESDLQW